MKLTSDSVLEAISDITMVSVEDILSHKRSAKDGIVDARFIAYSIFREVFNLSFQDIQKIMERKTHVAVMYGLRSMKKDEEKYKKLMEKRSIILQVIGIEGY